MSLTDRDKKLLFVLLIILIAFGYYNFFYKALSDKMNTVIQENQSLKNRYDEIKQRILIYNTNKNKLTEIEDNYNKISSFLPPNQDEKFTVLDVQRLAKQYRNTLSNITISQKQNLNIPQLQDITQTYFYSLQQNWQLSYEDFKKLLSSQKDFTPLYSIDTIAISNLNGKLNVSFNLKFYGFTDTLAPQRLWPELIREKGKSNLFK